MNYEINNDTLIFNYSNCSFEKLVRIDNFLFGGCMDSTYQNYNPHATFDNGTCNNNSCYSYDAANREKFLIKEPPFLNK